MKTMLRIAGLTIILLGVRMETARALPRFCFGTCTVTCDSGAVHYYSTTDFDCCNRIAPACSGDGTAEWDPGTGPECFLANALVC